MEALPDPTVASVVAAYFAAIRAKDFDAWDQLFAAGAIQHDPVGAPPVEDRTARKEVWNILTAPFDQLDLREQRTFYGGGSAAVFWRADVTGIGGGQARFEGITVFDVGEDGKIQTLMSYWDPGSVMIELADGGQES